MRVVAFAVLTLAVLIGVFIYDYTRKKRKHDMLKAIRDMHDGPIKIKKAVSRLSLMAAYPSTSSNFLTTLSKLKEEDLITEEEDKIRFTHWGKKYYETKIDKKARG